MSTVFSSYLAETHSHLQPSQSINTALLNRYRLTGDIEARNQLWLLNMRLIVRGTQMMFPFFSSAGITHNELLDWAQDGFLEAVRDYDIKEGMKFSSYVLSRIRWYSIRGRQMTGTIRVPVYVWIRNRKIEKAEFDGVTAAEDLAAKTGLRETAVLDTIQARNAMQVGSLDLKYDDSNSDTYGVKRKLVCARPDPELQLMAAEEAALIMRRFLALFRFLNARYRSQDTLIYCLHTGLSRVLFNQPEMSRVEIAEKFHISLKKVNSVLEKIRARFTISGMDIGKGMLSREIDRFLVMAEQSPKTMEMVLRRMRGSDSVYLSTFRKKEAKSSGRSGKGASRFCKKMGRKNSGKPNGSGL